MAVFYFNSNGDAIAYRRQGADKFLFNENGDWIGWFPWGTRTPLIETESISDRWWAIAF